MGQEKKMHKRGTQTHGTKVKIVDGYAQVIKLER